MIALLQLPLVGVTLERFLLLLITALAGGAFGASLGALPAFIFTGFLVFLGEGLAILQRELGGTVEAVPAGELAVGVTGVIGFGPITGPHIAFAGGVAATAYAGRKYPEMEPDDWDYHFGKDILYAFGTKPDILAVGAIFGALGMVIARVSGTVGIPTDGVALSVVATAFLARVAFDYPLVGRAAGASLLDMTPFERGEHRPAAARADPQDGGDGERVTDGGDADRSDNKTSDMTDTDGSDTVTETDGGTARLATEPWLPHQYRWSGVAAIGAVGGVLAGFIWLETGSVFLGYAISAMSLLFLQLGVEKIPVTHHITLMGAVGAVVAASAIGTVPVIGATPIVVLVAGLFGVVSGLLGEVTQRLFYAHSGTHVDPPAMAITLVMLAVGVLFLLDLLPTASYLGL